jgi:hypothetical protein
MIGSPAVRIIEAQVERHHVPFRNVSPQRLASKPSDYRQDLTVLRNRATVALKLGP